MLRQEWVSVKVPLQLALEIDKVIEKTRNFGVRKYNSRPDFIQMACVTALAAEHGRKTVEAVAK